ncbi:C40 family peptidase [Actinomadura gamaensis]|uniref:C40 family peptidase n=1 Tax=Actinomadura gamaensis TaxID=1763541 RepID=A0ABV9U2I8_9ACTN
MRRWQARAEQAVRFATWQIGRPYVWGGSGPRGFDCSGLTQQAWRHAGVKLPRVAADQYRVTRPHVPINRLRPGDLVFFHGLGHVGIYAGKGLFIHSPHTGRTVTFERLRGWYRANYVGAARPGWVPLPHLPPAPPAGADSDANPAAQPAAQPTEQHAGPPAEQQAAQPAAKHDAQHDAPSAAPSDASSAEQPAAQTAAEPAGQATAQSTARPASEPAAQSGPPPEASPKDSAQN